MKPLHLRRLAPRLAVARPLVRAFSLSPARANVFDELKAGTEKNALTVIEIDKLIANSPDLRDDPFGLGMKNPRDVAKSLPLVGPNSGRTVEVNWNNVRMAMKRNNDLVNSNNIKTRWFEDKVYIPPGKKKAERKRKWWRLKFKVEFSKLMAQIQDAKRRGY